MEDPVKDAEYYIGRAATCFRHAREIGDAQTARSLRELALEFAEIAVKLGADPVAVTRLKLLHRA